MIKIYKTKFFIGKILSSFGIFLQVAAWLEWRQKNKPSKPSILNPISRPPQAFANLLLNTNSTGSGAGSGSGVQPQQQHPQYIRATHSAPNTPAKLTGLTAVIRAQQPGIPANSSPVATSIASTAGTIMHFIFTFILLDYLLPDQIFTESYPWR